MISRFINKPIWEIFLEKEKEKNPFVFLLFKKSVKSVKES